MLRSIASEVCKDRAFYGAIAAYGVVAFAFAHSVGSAHKFAPLLYGVNWTTGVLFVIAATVIYHALKALFTPAPLDHLKTRVAAMITAEAVAGVVMLLSLSVVYGVFTSTKTMLPDVGGFFADPWMAGVDAAIHGGDAWRRLRWLDPLTGAITYLYSDIWGICMVGLAVVATICAPLRHLRAQYIWTFMLCWIVLGNIIALAGMSAGPILYESVTGDPRFAELIARLEQNRDISGVVLEYRTILWDAYTHNRVGFGTGISAFPSMHLSMATLLALYSGRIHRWLGAIFTAFGAVIMMGSVHLGWHYAIDGYVSILVTIAVWAMVGRALRRTSGQPSALSPALQPQS